MRILLFTLHDPAKNPRPNRIIKYFLSRGWQVDVCTYDFSGQVEVNKLFLIKTKFNKPIRGLIKVLLNFFRFKNVDFVIRDFLNGLLEVKNKIVFSEYDWIIVENIEFLHFAFSNKSERNKILVDLREFYVLEFGEKIVFRILETNYRKRVCKLYLNKCDKLITVSEGLKKAYKDWFGVECEVIYSAPYYANFLPQKVDSHTVKMVHHGGANKDRKLENMIAMFDRLDKRFCLDFYLVGDKNYINYLKKLSKPYSDRIRFLEPVPLDKILSTINSYDIGLYLLKDTNYNTQNALPNKFFEFVQARLMLAVGPTVDMKKLIEKFNLGIVSPTFDPSDMANLLNSLSNEQIFNYKQNSHQAAKFLCYENEILKLQDIFNK